MRALVSPQLNTLPLLDLLRIASQRFPKSSVSAYGLLSGGMYTTQILISYESDRHLPYSCSQTRESDSCANRTYLYSASDTKMSMPPESRLAHRCFIIRGKWKHWYPGKYCWKCFPFIVSTKAIMSCDLITVCKSRNPNLSPKPLMFKHRILTLLVVRVTKSFLSCSLTFAGERVSSLRDTYLLPHAISLITEIMLLPYFSIKSTMIEV